MNYRVINGQTYPVGNIEQLDKLQSKSNISNSLAEKQKATSFKDVLNNVTNKEKDFTISKHAALRLNEIDFTNEDLKAIERGFKIAEEKKSKNTVMLYKDIALIASVENKTLITAVDKSRTKENIFTNIDSVVIL